MNTDPPQTPAHPAAFKYKLPDFTKALQGDQIIRIVALGSSTTAGEGGIVPYPHRLEMLLRNQYPYPKKPLIDALNRGIGGEEAPKERSRLETHVLNAKPCLVIWQMGTNSAWQGPADNPPSHDDTISALRDGIEQLQNAETIDIILMDPQYLPAMLTRRSRMQPSRWLNPLPTSQVRRGSISSSVSSL